MGQIPPPFPKSKEQIKKMREEFALRNRGYEPINPSPVFDWLMSIVFIMIVVGAGIELLRILFKWVDNFLAGG